MINNKGFKFIIVIVGVMLWFFPQGALGEDTEIKNQLSYVSKIVGAIEGSIIKIEGNVRFIKRQAEKTIAEANVSVKRLGNLEAKIENIEGLLGTIAVEIAEIKDSMQNTEKNLKDLSRRPCSNAVLCERKK
jgi:chromosome segregation ATPase